MENKAEPTLDKDLTGADVWECDFSAFNKPGEYRLVVEGIGCSSVFTIGENRLAKHSGWQCRECFTSEWVVMKNRRVIFQFPAATFKTGCGTRKILKY